MNILFVFSDQQRYTALGANGNKVVQTPNLDQMASEGMVCDNMFSNNPLCTPFRGILLTGRYGWKNGVICNEMEPFRDIPTLPSVLRNAGYHTGHIGVWHLGMPPYPEENRYGLDLLKAVHGIGGNYYDQSYHENDKAPIQTEGWSPTAETSFAIDFMKDHKETRGDDPFALFVSWRPPHWPYPAHPKEFEVYDPANMDLPGNVPPQMADFARQELTDYYASCTGLDAEMGRLLSALKALDLADDTIVCYSSDHGDHLSSHGYGKPGDMWLHPHMRASKATPYDESAHIPFIIRWPGGTTPGTRTSTFMGAIDIVPGLLGACGVEAPEGFQGRDISPIWKGEESPVEPEHTPRANESVYLMNMGPGWPNREEWVGRWRGVRTERYTYARWYNNERHPWLFDRQEDPLETRNIAYSDEARPAVQEMEERLHRWMESTEDPFEYGKRGPRGFLDVGQRWFNQERYGKWSAS